MEKNEDITLRNEILFNSYKIFGARLFDYILHLLFIYLFIMIYNEDTYGLFTTLEAVFGIISIIGLFGLDTSMTKYIPEYLQKKKFGKLRSIYFKTKTFVFINSVILSIVVFSVSGYLAKNFANTDDGYFTFRLFSLIIVFLHDNLLTLQILPALKKLNLALLFKYNQNILLISIMVVSSFILNIKIDIFIAFCVVIVISCLLGNLFTFNAIRFKRNDDSDKVDFYNVIKISISFFLCGSLLELMAWMDKICLAIFTETTYVAVYSGVLYVAHVTTIFLYALHTYTAPKITELYSSGKLDMLNQLINLTSKLLFWISFPIYILIVLFSDQLLNIFGSEFIIGKYALIMLASASFVNASSGAVGFILILTGYHIIFQNIMIITAIFNLTFNIILGYFFGINGIAFSSMLSMIIWNFLSVFYVNKKCGIFTLHIPIIKNIWLSGSRRVVDSK